MKKGDKIQVLDHFGQVVDAVYLGISYRKNPKHYAVNVTIQTGRYKSGQRKVTWYLPESRIVGLCGEEL